MSKESSYKKLKKENAELKKDICILVKADNSLEYMQCLALYKHRVNSEILSLFGTRDVKRKGIKIEL